MFIWGLKEYAVKTTRKKYYRGMLCSGVFSKIILFFLDLVVCVYCHNTVIVIIDVYHQIYNLISFLISFKINISFAFNFASVVLYFSSSNVSPLPQLCRFWPPGNLLLTRPARGSPHKCLEGPALPSLGRWCAHSEAPVSLR